MPAAFWDALDFFLHLIVVLVPLFIGASFLVGLVREYLPPAKVERALRGHDAGTGNVIAAAFGAVTPFCSCSTVPVLAGLLQAGAPLGLAISFLLASPLVNEVAVILLLGLFGPAVTGAYVAVTFLAAVIGGIVIGRFEGEGQIRDEYLPQRRDDRRTAATDGGTAECSDGPSSNCQRRDVSDCCSGSESTTSDSHRERIATAASEACGFFRETLPYLLLGMTLGALIHGFVPVEVLRTVLGSENPLAVPLAAVAGAPVYISLSGMLPIAASLSDRGIAIGTVLAFVVGGAGVSIPNLVLLRTLFERRLLAVYAGTVVAIGVTVGLVFNTLLA